MIPAWLVALAIVWLVLAFIAAGVILVDELTGDHALMPVMTWVWPITALYMGPVAIGAYWTMDRAVPMQHGTSSGGGQRQEHGQGAQQPFWQIVFKGVTHCGAGCTLGDICGEWAIFISAATLAGITLWPAYIVDYILAYALGIVFQYLAIAPMRGLRLRQGIIAAVKADTLSLTAFEIGLFAWMAIYSFILFNHTLHPDSPVYWFMMQIGMVVGFATAYPMNWWLIKTGIKEAM